MPKTLIVPVDGSPASERAVAVARELVERFDHCELLVMSAEERPDAAAREAFGAFAERLGLTHFRCEFVEGREPADAIAAVAAGEPDAAICMATHGRGRLVTPLLGSVATAVVRRVECPVVLVGPHCEPLSWDDPPRLLTCWCGSGSDAVLPVARDWAVATGAQLWIELVFHPLDVPSATGGNTVFAPAVERVGHDVDVHVQSHADSYPAGAIVRDARELPATLIAMTTHARSGLARAVLGSVAIDVVHHSPCPVLVVRQG